MIFEIRLISLYSQIFDLVIPLSREAFKDSGAIPKQHNGHIKNIVPGINCIQVWDKWSINKNNN